MKIEAIHQNIIKEYETKLKPFCDYFFYIKNGRFYDLNLRFSKPFNLPEEFKRVRIFKELNEKNNKIINEELI